MAIDPATAKLIAKVLVSQITDEEKRQRLIIIIVISIILFILLLATPILILTNTLEDIGKLFGWKDEKEMLESGEYASVVKLKENYGTNLEKGELVFYGELPMPVNNAVVTSEYGSRLHPITRQT